MTDMPAGAELDILVAERVFRWPIIYYDECPGHEWWDLVPHYPCLIVHSDGSNWIVRSKSDEDPLDSFEPSTDWAAAGEVLEKLVDVKLIRQERIDVRFHVDTQWQCYANGHWGVGETGPLAIAHAAVNAAEKGGE